MKQQVLTKENITEEMEKKIEEAEVLCGAHIRLTSDVSVSANAFTSTALKRMELLAGYDGHHIERIMEKELIEPLKTVHKEVGEVFEKAFQNTLDKAFKEISKEIVEELSGGSKSWQNSEKAS